MKRQQCELSLALLGCGQDMDDPIWSIVQPSPFLFQDIVYIHMQTVAMTENTWKIWASAG